MSVKILVVDDEPDLEPLVRQKFRRQARQGEYEFSFARNGLEALECLRADRQIELVLTDLNMPVMNGLTLLSNLGEFNPVLKAVVISAYGDLENIRAAMNRGAYDFLTKPIDLDDLEITINKTAQWIQFLKQTQEEHEQLRVIQEEMNVATRIQQSLLPCDFPPFPWLKEIDLYAAMIPAREVGGDFYDFFLLDEDRLGVVIGDVSGKGVPAAIFMAVTRTLLKSVALTGAPAGQCLEQVNRLLSLENSSFMFVTLFYGILNLRSGEFDYCNAGHNPPSLVRASGAVEPLISAGAIVLGVDEAAVYQTDKTRLQRGETLFLYTDGITEAFDVWNEQFSDRRLRECLERAADARPREMIEMVADEVRRFSDGAPQSDDLTMLAVKYLN